MFTPFCIRTVISMREQLKMFFVYTIYESFFEISEKEIIKILKYNKIMKRKWLCDCKLMFHYLLMYVVRKKPITHMGV